MVAIFHDPVTGDDDRRARVFDGDLFVFSPRPTSLALVDHARAMAEEAFGGLDPRTAQEEISPEEFSAICAPLKPAFIHHPRTKELIRDLLLDLGCDAHDTYLDVPRLRMMASGDYLRAGVAFQLHPHRDTWYSAPLAQLNWWLPIYDVTPESAMAFHLRYFAQGVRNSSDEFNYYRWNATGRKDAAKHVKQDTRKQPVPLDEVELEPQVRLIPPRVGIILFSGAHLHSTVPNTSGLTRWSLDFRTVNRTDLEADRSAPNADSAPEGTALRDFMRAADFERLPAELVARYDNVEPDEDAVLVFAPQTS